MLAVRLIVLFFFIITRLAIAQQSVIGFVFDENSHEPLANVIVLYKASHKWTVTDEQGKFTLQLPKSPQLQLEFQLLGKATKEIVVNTEESLSTPLKVYLSNKDLRLEEVVVSAKKGNDYSEIILGEEVINQVQSFSINEVLEQLPGQEITNFNLSEFKPIVFRSVKPPRIADDGFGNKSFGTAVVVDDIPISNNGNMQSYAGNSSSPFSPNTIGFGDSSRDSFNDYFPNPNFGVDLRQIATQNIENIEVVQGIPSAKYGDLTSGLIKIDQKAGHSPFQLYTSLRNGTTEYGLKKGVKLNEKLGFLNISLSYLNSNANPRVSFKSYERINSQLMWSWTNIKKNIRNSLSVRYGFNKDDVNYEEEDQDQKRIKNEQKDISISNRFKWNFEDAFINHLAVNANFSYSDQYTYQSQLYNSGGDVVGFLTEEGVYEGIYTAPVYTMVKAVEGIPISAYAAADIYKTFSVNDWSHNLSAGVSYRVDDNKGRGRLGSPETMVSALTNNAGSGGTAFRPYNFEDNVQAESQYSLYLEDQVNTYWKNNKFNLTAGLRTDVQNSFVTLSPRLNTYYIHKNLKIRGGIGLTAKSPSLNQLYTGYRFYDVVLGDFRVPGVYNVGVVQTFKEKENNPDIKPSRSLRSELGLDYKFGFGTLNLTGFYNKLYNGITSSSYPIARELAQVSVNEEAGNPEIVVEGYEPYYYTQSVLANDLESEDIGVEFFMNIPDIFQNFNVDLQGSYTHTVNTNQGNSFVKSSDASQEEKFGINKNADQERSRWKLGANLNYHLPQIGLVIAIRSEHFIFYKSTSEGRNAPYAYINSSLEEISIPVNDRLNESLYGHITELRSANTQERKKVYHNFHLRVSKDFLNGFRFSFYANNFLDVKPTAIEYENGRDVKRVNSDIVHLSFGTKIEYQF